MRAANSNGGLTVTFHGVRGSTPSPGPATSRFGGNTSCVEVRAGNEIFILDAGTGIRALGTKLLDEFADQPITARLLISHTHWDHIQGLPFFAPAYGAQNRIQVFAAKGGGPTVTRALCNQMDAIHFPVGLETLVGLSPVQELASNDVVFGPVRVRVAALNHPGGCAGFRIETPTAAIAYLPDHEPKESSGSLVDFVRGADLLILDTQYTEAEYPKRRGWGHGWIDASVALALNAGVRKLAFFHHDPSHDDDQIDRMVARGQELAGPSATIISAACENQPVTFGCSQVPVPSLSRFPAFPALVA